MGTVVKKKPSQNKQVTNHQTRGKLLQNALGIFAKFLLLATILLVIFGVIAFGRGYRIDMLNNTLSSTGILAISSSPRAAEVYINGDFKGATDVNINLPPGEYTVEVKKEGYISYKKTVKLKGEIVQVIDPILFPINPSLSPVTNIGIQKAIQIEQTGKIILLSQTNDREKSGIYLYEADDKPLNIFPPLKPLLAIQTLPVDVDLLETTLDFSPDYKEMIATFYKDGELIATYLLSTNEENTQPLDISNSKATLLAAWEDESAKNTLKVLEALPKKLRAPAIAGFSKIKFSPDENKILYEASASASLPLVIDPPLIGANQTEEQRNLKPQYKYVYDRKEDKNFFIADEKTDLADIYWYTDSKRIVYREPQTISIAQYDGQHKQVVYSGPLEDSFVAVAPNGKILVLANLNPRSNKLPDLYQVGIR